jgi:hypothetical protein
VTAGAALLAAVGGTLCYGSGEAVDLAALLGGERSAEQMVAASPGALDDLLAMAGGTR